MTARQTDAQIFQELCAIYIQKAQTLEVLEALRLEITELIKGLHLHDDDVVLVRAQFNRKKRDLLGGDSQ